ncbi:hypothetical protein TA3x_004286 [Tundrisphaera sp. TA3]|uniref:hypothetical protein n=1 Tax=Tundrisphaera sp. TA3 TaxID=3435775 RepID=UPI003EC08C2A
MELTEDQRIQLDIEWATASALRDGMEIASGRGRHKITYKQAEALGREVAPEIFLNVNRLLDKPNETLLAQEIRQHANAQSAVDRIEITPVQYITAEIKKMQLQIAALDDDEDRHLLENKIARYQDVRQELEPRENREAQLIWGDAIASGLGLPECGAGNDYKDYQLHEGRILRVRAAHLMALEEKIGCDLVYENLNCKEKTARLVMVQYKLWEPYDDVIHHNERDNNQINRMTNAACKNRLCSMDNVAYTSYRLPNCAAFVRPTDRLKEPTSKTVSSSLHIPICVMNESWQPNKNKGKSIKREYVRNRSLSHRTFGELFEYGMVGSKQITWDEMTEIYKSYGIFNVTERVMIHMQDARNF